MKKLFDPHIKAQITLDQKNLLGLSMLLLLAVDFIFGYFLHTYYADQLLNPYSPGFWLQILNYATITGIMLLNRWILPWSWPNLGMAKPDNLWKPVLVFLGTFLTILLFSIYIQPLILENFGNHQNIDFLKIVKGNFPILLSSLLLIWVIAFLEEMIFRAFFINSLDLLLGESRWATVGALVLSSLVFGSIHAYQGLTGMLITGIVGFIFGVAYLFNGRRIWPLIVVHGLLDTLTLLSIYNS